MMEVLVAAMFGLLLGSFLNVCIFRLHYDISLVKPSRSFCPQCEATIAWYDNIPLLSYVLLRGKCRACQARISWRYPVVELLTAVCFGLAVYQDGVSWISLKKCLFSFICIDLIFTDFEERILPDEFTLGGTAVGIMIASMVPQMAVFSYLLFPVLIPEWSRWMLESAVSAVLCSGSLYGISLLYRKIRNREGMGLGDIKMIAMMGAFLGLMPTLFSLMVGSLMGSISGLGFIYLAKKDAATYELPFGSFLGIAALGIAFFGPKY